ncbi:MAG: SEC-C metal-binding domain-containing protein [Chloroflexota bacterium]|nr:SEC-C metal-binding domain-containing protein [Chloroflexota bacterium]MDE2946485.1 SEC-C metal-binding domain-containing protein [Chloroflexota bacterium]
MADNQDKLKRIDQHLRSITNRVPDNDLDNAASQLLRDLKDDAVQEGDQDFAKQMWCLDAVKECQNGFIKAFNDMKRRHFFGAWISLARCENILANLERHFGLDVDGSDAYRLVHIAKCAPQFQRLYPYKQFFSAGFIVQEVACSICGQELSLRDSCGHVVGEIYSGELCGGEIRKADLLEVSFVENPRFKHAVPFVNNSVTGKSEDHYNYASVHYAVENLTSPFAAWDLIVHKRQRLVSDFNYVGRNDPCPCGSGDKFKKCCMRKKYLLRQHYDIGFPDGNPEHLPPIVDNAIVRGKPRYPLDNVGASL